MAHGGELGIESEQERGTTVRFTLPGRLRGLSAAPASSHKLHGANGM